LPTIKSSPSLADVAAVYDIFAKRSVEAFNEEGAVPAQIYGVILQDEGAPGNVLGLLELSDDMVKEVFDSSANSPDISSVTQLLLQEGSQLRTLLVEDGTPLPCMVVQVSEGWAALGEADPLTNRSDIPPSQRVDRRECLLIILHTASSTHVGVCPIQGEPTRSAHYKPLQLVQLQNPQASLQAAGVRPDTATRVLH
jgi:hypothetical protein